MSDQINFKANAYDDNGVQVLKDEGLGHAAIICKIILHGKIQLVAPLLIGSGNDDGLTDVLVLKDKNGIPYIPGTSLAGVLRSLTNEREDKYFGSMRTTQSCIEVDDIELNNTKIIIRDSVRINPESGTAAEHGKFDYEAVERGATGLFNIVATVRAIQAKELGNIEHLMYQYGQLFLEGLSVGAHTTKGFGKVQAPKGTVELSIYDFRKPGCLDAWLRQVKPDHDSYIVEAGTVSTKNNFTINAYFLLNNSLIVRSSETETIEKCKKELNIEKEKINAVQMLSGDDYVIPGATIKGVLRNQALRIVKYLHKQNRKMIDDLFGYVADGAKMKSRLKVDEIYIKKNQGVKAYPQSRNKIDRFTGATVTGALFTEIPIWQTNNDGPVFNLKLQVQDCTDKDAGLLLFILKDLWTGQVAFGGEKSIGRGTLSGLQADITYNDQQFEIVDSGVFAVHGSKDELEKYATAFIKSESAGEEQ